MANGNGNDNDNDNGNGNFDLLKLHAPIIAVIGVIIFFVWCTWLAVTTLAQIERREIRIERAVEEIKENDERLKELIVRALDIYETALQKDRAIWCLKAMEMNPSWKCPSFGDNFKVRRPRR